VSELALTVIRLGFLALLWVFVLVTVFVLRKDLRAPADARPGRVAPPRRPASTSAKAAKAAKAKGAKVRGTKLVVTEGPLTGTIVPLTDAQVTIGRAPDSVIVVDDDYASSRHARVYAAEGAWVVEDLGSTNGTWIERTRITTPTVLQVGAALRVGRTTMQLQK
jgi:pSer/pThr/pTyr-binding forkhead associated (FHA) protein